MNTIVALTGGSGFVGRRVVQCLIDAQAHVRMLVRDPARLDLPDSTIEIIPGDISDTDALNRLVTGAGTVIHIAGAIAAKDRQAFERVNVAGTAKVVTAAAQAGVAKFVHLSSMAAREPGLSDYADSKRAGEAALANTAGSMPWVVIRPPAVYGPGDKATLPLIAQMARKRAILPGAVNNRTSLIHVDDLADALVWLALSGGPEGSIHELDDGTTGGYSWHELATIAAATEGRQIKVHHIPRSLMMAAAHAAELVSRLRRGPAILSPGKVRELYHADWVARHDLLQQCSDWRPAIDFSTGFASTLDWYRRHNWLPDAPGKARTPNGADQRETMV